MNQNNVNVQLEWRGVDNRQRLQCWRAPSIAGAKVGEQGKKKKKKAVGD